MPEKYQFCYESPTKAPSLVGAFVENLYTKAGFRAKPWQNLACFMPRKGYDRGTKKNVELRSGVDFGHQTESAGTTTICVGRQCGVVHWDLMEKGNLLHPDL